MKCSEITLREAITNIKDFLPVKIIFNGYCMITACKKGGAK